MTPRRLAAIAVLVGVVLLAAACGSAKAPNTPLGRTFGANPVTGGRQLTCVEFTSSSTKSQLAYLAYRYAEIGNSAHAQALEASTPAPNNIPSPVPAVPTRTVAGRMRTLADEICKEPTLARSVVDSDLVGAYINGAAFPS